MILVLLFNNPISELSGLVLKDCETVRGVDVGGRGRVVFAAVVCIHGGDHVGNLLHLDLF